MATHQQVQAVCKAEWVKQRSLAEGTSDTVHVLFIPAAVAEGGFLVKGYLWWLFRGVNTWYSLYNRKRFLDPRTGVIFALYRHCTDHNSAQSKISACIVRIYELLIWYHNLFSSLSEQNIKLYLKYINEKLQAFCFLTLF